MILQTSSEFNFWFGVLEKLTTLVDARFLKNNLSLLSALTKQNDNNVKTQKKQMFFFCLLINCYVDILQKNMC